MLESVEFKNFKVLRDTKLPLSRLTLIVGPNGSGKSTALQALQAIRRTGENLFHQLVTAGMQEIDASTTVEILLHWGRTYAGVITTARWSLASTPPLSHDQVSTRESIPTGDQTLIKNILAGIRVYSLNADLIAATVQLARDMELGASGQNFAGVLDGLRDVDPERFEALNAELGRWLPEYDRILFETPGSGQRGFLLRTREGH